MTPTKAVASVIDPALALLASLGGPPASHDATRLLLAIAAQESGLTARYQDAPSTIIGPARGLWQFEITGVRTVLGYNSTSAWLASLCVATDTVARSDAIWRAIEGHDILAAGLARLMLWPDPAPLPTNEQAGFDYYIRCWQPGAPSRSRWSTSWATAVGEVP